MAIPQEQAGGGGGGGSMQGGGGKDTEFREQDGHYFNEDKARLRGGRHGAIPHRHGLSL